MDAPDQRLLDLATSVSDGTPVDWDAAEHAARDEDERELLGALRAIAGIAEAHRSWHGPEETGRLSAAGEVVLERWGQLEILDRVGHGSFGEVYRARDPQLDRVVALKLLRRRDAEGPSDLSVIEEGRLLARIRHSNVVTVYGADEQEGRVGLWMEFIEGSTLAELLRKQGPLGAREATLLGIDLCRAIAAVHARGIVHRDIKAQNVMREMGGRIVLMDFGIGRDLMSEGEEDRSISGTPLYLAPEVLAGAEATILSDLYSLGVLLYHLVTGDFPVRAESITGLRRAHGRGEVRLLRDLRPDLPQPFVEIVEKALSPDPARRFPSAGALERALLAVLSADETVAAGPPSRTPAWRSRRVLGFLAAAAILALVLAFLLRPESPPTPHNPVAVETVLVGDFVNRTGVALFSPTLRELVSLGLGQSTRLRVLSRERIAEALKRMEKPSSTPLDSETARELALRENLDTYVVGEIAFEAGGYRVAVKVADAQSGRVRALQTIEVPSDQDLVSRVDSLTGRLRQKLGEPRALVEQNRKPLEQVTTRSLEALYRYSQALDLHSQQKIELAIDALELAVRLDPQFATAYNRLAIYRGGIGDYPGAFAAASMAFRFRGRVSEREGHRIAGTYHLDCLQYDEALHEFEQSIVLDPGDSEGYRQIAMLHANLGEAAAGIEPARKARDLLPTSVINEGVLILLYAQAGRPGTALKELASARKSFVDDTYLYWSEGVAWLMQGNVERAKSSFRSLAKGDTIYASSGRLLLAQTLMLEGHLREALALLESDPGLDRRKRFERNDAIRNYLIAKAYALLGKPREANQYLQTIADLPDLPTNLKLLRNAAVLATEIGDLELARSLLRRIRWLHDLYPSGLGRGAVAQVRGEIERAEGRFPAARRDFQEAHIHWADAGTLRSLSRFWLEKSRCDRALPFLQQIVKAKGRILGDFYGAWADWTTARKELAVCRSRGLAEG